MPRFKKVMSAEDAAAVIKNGDMVALGGLLLQNKPMVMIRSLIRRGIKDLFVVPAGPASMDVDMLVGANCVRRLVCASVSFEMLAPVGPRFRQYVQQGNLDLWECSQGIARQALRAAGMGLPFLPTKSGLGTDLLRVNSDLKLFNDPIKGELLVAVPAIKPDVAIIITKRSDPYGNAQHGGATMFDTLAWRAADKVIVVTEEVVDPDVIRADPFRTTVSCERVVAVVEAPYGAHPCANHGCYPVDEKRTLEYITAARSDEAFRAYMDKYVYGPKNHEEYLQLIGVSELWGLTKYIEEEES